MTERISNDDWDLMKAHYIREFDEYTKFNGMELDIEWMEGMLDKFWEMWTKGTYCIRFKISRFFQFIKSR